MPTPLRNRRTGRREEGGGQKEGRRGGTLGRLFHPAMNRHAAFSSAWWVTTTNIWDGERH